MRCPVAILFLWAVLALLQPARASGELPAACSAPDDLVTSDTRLGRFAAKITAGGPIDILAVGSATMVGAATVSGQQLASPAEAFPWQMIHALKVARPSVDFRLTVRGGRGMTAEDMLQLMDTALKQQHYTLVLWQTGTVEAVRGLQPSGMLDILHVGAERVREAGGDLVLIDPQFSRFLRANTDLDPYETVMQQVATMPGVALFHRFELMRVWANEGRIDLERTQKTDREKVLGQLNVCLGQALARFVLSGADLGR